MNQGVIYGVLPQNDLKMASVQQHALHAKTPDTYKIGMTYSQSPTPGTEAGSPQGSDYPVTLGPAILRRLVALDNVLDPIEGKRNDARRRSVECLVPLSSHAKRLTICPATCHPPTYFFYPQYRRTAVFGDEKYHVAFLFSVRLVVTVLIIELQ
jgi:hypothetical protein